MWELASIINFFNVFRPVLNFKFDYSFEELESALLSPNALLDDIHMTLLKAIPPYSRAPLSRETWVMMLCKKLKGWWQWVADGSFPLVPYHGEETATYKELDPDVRVIILKALCEVRLDQEDMRSFIDDTLKQGAPYSTFRRERLGIDMQGTTYWYENDPVSGQRLYRELRKVDNKLSSKVRGRQSPFSAACYWETLATNLEEFQAVADKLISSRTRMEAAIGKRINNDVIPNLKDLQKKKERVLKKQQRQAFLLDSFLMPGGLAAGRSRRERKPVTYTFDDYDKSISEAIKITKRPSSPESFIAEDNKVANGLNRQSEGEDINNHSEDRCFTETASQSKLNDGSLSSGSEFSLHGQSRRRRHHRRPQRYSESDFVEAVSDNEADAYSEDEIEGEAVYDDDYVRKRKRRKSLSSSDGDEEYRGDEDDEEEEEEEDDDDVDDDNNSAGQSDDGDYIQELHTLKHAAKGKRRGKLKSVEELQWGLRRSKRATRSNVDYSKYDESDMEGDEYMEELGTSSRENLDTAVNLANSSENRGNGCNLEEIGLTAQLGDSDELELRGLPLKEVHNGVTYKPNNRLNFSSQTNTNPVKKPHRYLDLNLAAPVGGHDDSSAGYSRGPNGSLNQATEVESSGNDESTSDSPKAFGDGLVR